MVPSRQCDFLSSSKGIGTITIFTCVWPAWQFSLSPSRSPAGDAAACWPTARHAQRSSGTTKLQ